MSFRYAAPGVYRCDTKGCDAKVLGNMGELPERWRQEEVNALAYGTGQDTELIVAHRCPKCVAKEAKP